MKDTCKPGGCSSLGCDGGHYCFRADGTPIPGPSPEELQKLREALGFKDENDPTFDKADPVRSSKAWKRNLGARCTKDAQQLAQQLVDQLNDPKARIRPGMTTEEIQQQINDDISKETVRRATQARDRQLARVTWGSVAAAIVVLVIIPLTAWWLTH